MMSGISAPIGDLRRHVEVRIEALFASFPPDDVQQERVVLRERRLPAARAAPPGRVALRRRGDVFLREQIFIVFNGGGSGRQPVRALARVSPWFFFLVQESWFWGQFF